MNGHPQEIANGAAVEQLEESRRRLAAVEERVARACGRAGRARSEVTLLAVVKKRPVPVVRGLVELGVGEMAENRVQEARTRIPQVGGNVQWHLIGSLQTNKAKYIPGLFSTVHSVDRAEVAEALAQAMEKRAPGRTLDVYLQFNIAGEEQKHGATEEEARTLLEVAGSLGPLRVRGLMCMAPYSDNPEEARPVFRELRELRDRLAAASGLALGLSMGMSGDFEVAIEEGSTIVRVGSALFEDLEP